MSAMSAMSTSAETTWEQTDLAIPEVAHLHHFLGTWQLIADLSFNRHSPDPSGFEPKIAPLSGVGNGKFRLASVKGGRSGRLTVPKR